MATIPEKKIEEVINKLDTSSGTKFPGMTYEEGVDEALRWVLGEIPDDEFEFAPKK